MSVIDNETLDKFIAGTTIYQNEGREMARELKIWRSGGRPMDPRPTSPLELDEPYHPPNPYFPFFP